MSKNEEFRTIYIYLYGQQNVESIHLVKYIKNIYNSLDERNISSHFVEIPTKINNVNLLVFVYLNELGDNILTIESNIHLANIFLFIYDPSKRTSFDSLNDLINKVKEKKRKQKDNYIFAIAENNKNEKREVTYEEGKKLAEKYNVAFAGESNGNFENEFSRLFKGLIEEYYNNFIVQNNCNIL